MSRSAANERIAVLSALVLFCVTRLTAAQTQAALSLTSGETASGAFEAQATELRRLTALANLRLEAAFLEWKAALERAPQARALPDPRFTYRYFI